MNELNEIAELAVKALKESKYTVATAESCTGGLIAATLTTVPHVSENFRFGWVTYCNDAKVQELGVNPETIEKYTVVSEPVVQEMAEGAMNKANSDFGIAVSGNAGPTAAEGEPPVGTVCIAVSRRPDSRTVTKTIFREGLERNEFRKMVAIEALTLLYKMSRVEH